jgi:hypothetical protein
VRVWQLLRVLIEKEAADPGRQFSNNLSIEELVLIAGRDDVIEEPWEWRRRLFDEFDDEEKRAFVTPGNKVALKRSGGPGRRRQEQLYKFSSHFEECATHYVRGTITSVLKMPVDMGRLDAILTTKGPELYRKVFAIMQSDYIPAWVTLMRDIAKAVKKPAAADTFLKHASYWTVSVIVWKHHSVDPKAGLTERDFYQDAQYALRTVSQEEVRRVVKDLISKMVLKEQDIDTAEKSPARYILNEDCFSSFDNYGFLVRTARGKLLDLLRVELS